MYQDSTWIILGMSYAVPAYAKQLALAAFLGMLIGVERAWHRKVASLRTFALMCAGSCMFSLISIIAAGTAYDPTRIAASIVTGIGFLGGGVIFKTQDRIEGITTGAMIFFASAIGMACGYNHCGLAITGFVTYVSIHMMGFAFHRLIRLLRPAPKH